MLAQDGDVQYNKSMQEKLFLCVWFARLVGSLPPGEEVITLRFRALETVLFFWLEDSSCGIFGSA
jgi:hypothetical protein